MKTESFDNAGSILSHVASLQVMPCGLRKDGVVKAENGKLKTESFDNAGSILSHVASPQVMPFGLRKDGVVKAEN